MVVKSKGIILIIFSVALAIIGGSLIVLFTLNSKTSDVGKFDLSKYQWEIQTFPSDKNVGQVDDKNGAIEKAKALWLEKYNTLNEQSYHLIKDKKIEVSYDSEEKCWHINGILPSNTVGGVPHALIRKNGEVIAVWIDD